MDPTQFYFLTFMLGGIIGLLIIIAIRLGRICKVINERISAH